MPNAAMLRYVCHDLFESPAQTLVNTVNTVGVMGKGIALEFKRRYPLMFERYAAHCESRALTTGQLYLFRTANKWVLNFPTKHHWRAPSRIEWIEAGLQKFVDSYEAQGITSTSASFPQLGCGNGGLDWAAVKPLMDRYLRSLPIPIFVHIRISDPRFIPEHQQDERTLICGPEAHHAPAASVSFHEFLADLLRLDGEQGLAPEHEVIEADEPPPLPEIEIRRGGKRLRVTGETLQHIWNKLVLRGALPTDGLPGLTSDDSTSLAHSLKRLSYIKPIAFVGGSLDKPQLQPGIRYSPPPGHSPLNLLVPRAAEHRTE